MAFTNIRSGNDVLAAAKFQTAQGVAATAFANVNILRATDLGGINPNVEFVAQQGTSGSCFEQDTATIESITPEIEAELKAGPENIEVMMKSFLSINPVNVAGGLVGQIKEFQGCNGQIDNDKFLTWIWSDKFESLRAVDVWINSLRFTSRAKESMHLTVSGRGRTVTKLSSDLLAGLSLIHLDNYAHKESHFFDELSLTPQVDIALIALELNLEQDVGVINANAVSPTFVHKDGRIKVSGTLTARLYDDTAPWIDRILALTRATYRGTWKTRNNRTLEIILRNMVLGGDITPRVSEDGTMDDFSVNFTAYGTASNFPFTLRVEV